MAAVSGVRALCLHRSVILQRSFGLVPVQLPSTCLPRKLCSATTTKNEPKPPVVTENESLLENLNLMGVNVPMVRQRQPRILLRSSTNEHGLAQFLQGKGASSEVIASIISRYPRAITRSIAHMEERWNLWRYIFCTDAEIVTILDRSPESFFRSSDNENLAKNIHFLISLGMDSKKLHRLLTTAPRTFSNSFELNQQMVELLKDICTELGGQDPEYFVKTVISKNLYILIRSTKRVKSNVDTLKSALKLPDSELLALLESHLAGIMDLSTEYLKKNLNSLQEKIISLGCQKSDIKKLIISYPSILYIGTTTLSAKLDCLLDAGITIQQIVKTPRVLDYSTQNITGRLTELQRLGYDFKKDGINILDKSRKRFDEKIKKLAASQDS